MFLNKKPNGLLEEIITENNKSNIQVNQVKNTRGNYPFFTSGDAILEFNEYFVDNFNCFLNTGGNADVKCYYGKAAYSTDTWSITGKNNYSIYLYLLLSFIKPELQVKYFLGTGLKHLQKPMLKKKAIYIPTTNEIQSLNQFLEPVVKMISNNINENVKYKNLRDYLLPLLINGQATIS